MAHIKGRISKYENIVAFILEKHEETRGDDKLLYLWVLREECFNTKLSLEDFLLGSYHGSKFPNFDTITRVRRKLQEKYPELRPPKGDQIRREEAEQEYLDYARE